MSKMIAKLVVVLLSLSFASFIDKSTATLDPLLGVLTSIASSAINPCTSNFRDGGLYSYILGHAYMVKTTGPSGFKCYIVNITYVRPISIPILLGLSSISVPAGGLLQSGSSCLDSNNTRQTPPPSTVIVQIAKQGEGTVVGDNNEILRVTEIVAYRGGKGYGLTSCSSNGQMTHAIFSFDRPTNSSNSTWINSIAAQMEQTINQKIAFNDIHHGNDCVYIDPSTGAIVP